MNKILIVILLVVFFFVGCMSQEEANDATKKSIQNPELIAENTPKGSLWCFTVTTPPNGEKHYIYYFGDSQQTISINRSVQRGKSHVIQTVVLDGIEYTPKEK